MTAAEDIQTPGTPTVRSMSLLDDLENFRRLHFPWLNMANRWSEYLKAPPPKFRPGKTQIEMLVRHINGDEEWQPINMNYGRQVLVDAYHPLVAESSAAGGKHSRKAKSSNNQPTELLNQMTETGR